MIRSKTALALSTVLALSGCAPTALDDAVAETGIEGPFEAVPEEGKYDGSSARGPAIGAGASTEVWPAENAWTDTTTAAAREAGMAWGADSGLDWEQKFDLWIASFETEARAHGSGQTFIMTTPYGDRSFHAPTLECAEVALMLRATFAAWYHLPFYIQGWDARGRQTMYAGHFGFVNSSGQRVGNFPSFRTSYTNHEGSWSPGDAWPSDARLRGYRLGDDDRIEFLSDDDKELGAGAYFDEIFLNKRAGYFLRLLLLYFGSANLADGANMFHIQPEVTEAGDLLIHRWQQRGIGHVMPIFRVQRHAEDAIEITIASGSMPRREPVWEEPNRARSSFTASYAGGSDEADDGKTYAHYGGGVRRWRSAVLSGGRWRNEVPERDRESYINDQDFEAVGARPDRFGEILRTLSAAERRQVALDAIDAAREHLGNYPASCAARGRREDAFASLYELMAESGQDRASVDATYRTLEDYVFAALEYEVSRTCCWNSSTSAMYEIIMANAEAEQAAATAAGMCAAPSVFRAETDGYARWQTYADSIGRGGEWVAWSEDETCSQRDVAEDTVDAARGVTAFCDRGEPVEPPVEPPAGAGCNAVGGGSQDMASILNYNNTLNAELCSGDEDWYRVDSTSQVTVTVSFIHASGDIDVEVQGLDGSALGSSTSTSDAETVTATGPFYVRVYGYDGAANSYSIVVR